MARHSPSRLRAIPLAVRSRLVPPRVLAPPISTPSRAMGDFPPPPTRPVRRDDATSARPTRGDVSSNDAMHAARACTTIAVRLSEASPPRPVRFPRYSSRIAPPSPSFRDPRPARAPSRRPSHPAPSPPRPSTRAIRLAATRTRGTPSYRRSVTSPANPNLRPRLPKRKVVRGGAPTRPPTRARPSSPRSDASSTRRPSRSSATRCRPPSRGPNRRVRARTHSPRARDPSSYLFDTCPTKCPRANSRGGFATSSSNASASGETRRRTRSPRRRRRRNERERKRTRTTRTPRVVSASPRVGFWQPRAGARISLGGTSRRRSRMRDSQPRARPSPAT